MIVQMPVNIKEMLLAMRESDPQRFVKLVIMILSDFEKDINLRTDFSNVDITTLYIHLTNILKILKLKALN